MDADVEALAAEAATDPAAMDRLLRRIEPEVLRRCGRFLPCREDAEEACQDALLKVSANLAGFQWRSKFSTWLHTIVSNSALSTYRSLKRRSERLSGDEALELRPDPRTTSVIAGSRLDLLDALEKLDASKPQVVRPFILRDISQLTYAEIAEELDSPLGTVKSQVHDARQAIQQLLG
ncbi:RNA polymerase sigma-70 factor, ECF subfamily [Amycolatopsis xylanica]|uniref:RNA polymerase sigma-70 factor, ECF subfamily n=1 Tax=Amycolatopsis xylanica TaxID=589385 RepID=A0A1H3JFN9_9PSEU|nr:RNA polymerase sigma factor [Amycolatopsis xylanica]SDY38731.1 RNA polymerase sigma-70 factor, ECF subfamily [Amycolatopsis xylanica]